MLPETYKIRKAIVIPLAIAVFSLAALLSLSFPSLPGERFVLAVIFLIVLYLFLEVFSRAVSLGADGVEIKKFMRKKNLAWNDITYLGVVVISKKAYALLTTTKGFHILSNNYEKFSDLLCQMRGRLAEERVEGEIASLIERPLKNDKPVLSAWFMVMTIIAVIALRLFT
ncbi:MAG: hypothetical protein Q7I93_02000 [Syntrophales bacterium]|nr:hypothetical protein [Syntrophales bacterium]